MQLRAFGLTGRKVPVIGQGTWHMERARRADAVAALRRGLDLGMTHIDTAEMYGSGEAEEIVGEAVAGRRDEVFIVSKVLPDNASRSGTIAACERSLKRLKADYLDCYLLHWRGRHPLSETIAGFDALARSGKIKSWGVSNFDAEDLDEALSIAGEGKIACNQVLYHLKERSIEHAVVPWCAKHKVAVVAYSPFGSGGKFPDHKGLTEIAATHGVTPRAVALAFLTRERHVFAIPKSSNVTHVADNAAAGDVVLTPAEIAKLDAAFPLGRSRGLPML